MLWTGRAYLFQPLRYFLGSPPRLLKKQALTPRAMADECGSKSETTNVLAGREALGASTTLSNNLTIYRSH